jgi:hypothetical protein
LTVLAALIATAASSPAKASIRGAPGAQQVLIWEQTGGITQLPFIVNDPLLLARRAGNLAPANADYVTGAAEYYDFFYSNADGAPNQDGEYLTVECTYFGGQGPGLNINEVALVYAGGQQVFGCAISSAVYGTGGIAGSALFAADQLLNTVSLLGSVEAPTERLRLTVDFRCAPTPTKSSTWGSVKAIYR